MEYGIVSAGCHAGSFRLPPGVLTLDKAPVLHVEDKNQGPHGFIGGVRR